MNDKMALLKGKTIIVTGGTGTLGYNICKHLLDLKANVIFTCKDTNKALKMVSELRGNISYEYVDLTNDECIENFIFKYKDKVDILIHNAALNGEGNDVYMVNYLAVFKLNEINPKKIVYVASNTYKKKNIELDYYAYTKKLTLIKMIELKENGKNVCIAHPGITPSKLFDQRRKIPKFILKIIHMFMSKPSKASLAIIEACINDSELYEWFGPSIFTIYGKPKKSKLNKKYIIEVKNEGKSI